jgi:hypothetical protein
MPPLNSNLVYQTHKPPRSGPGYCVASTDGDYRYQDGLPLMRHSIIQSVYVCTCYGGGGSFPTITIATPPTRPMYGGMRRDLIPTSASVIDSFIGQCKIDRSHHQGATHQWCIGPRVIESQRRGWNEQERYPSASQRFCEPLYASKSARHVGRRYLNIHAPQQLMQTHITAQ